MALDLADFFADLEFLFSGRIYPGTLPESPTYPAAVYNVISGRRMRNIVGLSTNENMIVQVDIFSESYGDGDEIAKDMVEAMSQGTWVIGNQNDMRVSYEPDQNVHRFSLDFSLWQR